MGIVRAYQKGTLKGEATPEVQGAASSMKEKDVKKFASTKHKGLPEKKVTKESFNEDYVKELEDGLVKMDYPAYDEVDKLMQKIAKENDIDTTTLHMAFKTKHLMVPDDWAKRKMMEPVMIPKTPLKSVEECWKTHKKVGMKMKGGKLVNDCRPKNEEYVAEISAANPKRIKEPNPYSLKNKLKMAIKSVAAGPVREGGWDDVESIVFKNRANKGENTNPDFKQTVKNSKKNALKDLRDKLKNESTLIEMDNESSKRKDNKPKLTPIGDILKNISNDPEKKLKDQIDQKKREETNEAIEPDGMTFKDKKNIERQKQLKKASENAPKPENKIVPIKTSTTEEVIHEDDMKGMSVKSGHKRPTKAGAGMTKKGVEAYRRRNPGSKLKTAVTTKPSKLKKGSKAANRRKSYCARSAGQMKKFPKAAKDPNSRLRQARRRWNC